MLKFIELDLFCRPVLNIIKLSFIPYSFCHIFSESTQMDTSSAKTERRGRKRKMQQQESKSPVVNGTLDTDEGNAENNIESDVQVLKFTNVENDRRSEIRERKLAIQEELLVIEQKKMTMLQDIMTKLDKVLENQKKS